MLIQKKTGFGSARKFMVMILTFVLVLSIVLLPVTANADVPDGVYASVLIVMGNLAWVNLVSSVPLITRFQTGLALCL